MSETRVGIGDLQLFVPSPWIATDTLVRKRSCADLELQKYLERAVLYTGQRAFHFPEVWQDSATMAAEASAGLLKRRGDAGGLRYLVTGTETTVDHSKPVASYVAGMLEQSGHQLPVTHSTFQIQHACAGGTLSMFSIGALLNAARTQDEFGLAVCTDIARYASASSGEITQGAGAAALLVTRDPDLIEIDLRTAGYASRDVDDFFRPFGSDEARVKGQYSIRCYRKALAEAFSDHCIRRMEEPGAVLKKSDFFVLHVPYYSLPLDSMRSLLKQHLGFAPDVADAFLEERGFQSSIERAKDIGNLYSGSMFMSLERLLRERYTALGEGIIGKEILFASYGSGNTMVVFSGRIARRAPAVVERWTADLEFGPESDWEQYEQWNERHSWRSDYNKVLESVDRKSGFFLESIREDGFREYRFKG